MTAVFRKFKSISKLNIHRNIFTSTINKHSNKDWMAGPFPKTIEEHNAAAEKYNLHPTEYKPCSDDQDYGLGDYPNLPFKGVATRDPYYPYDFPEHRRNYNEPVHIDMDILGEDRCDVGVPERYSKQFTIISFLLFFSSMFGLMYISEYVPTFQPVTEKQYPWKGKTYYTFEKLK